MALSAAERARRYRENRDADPERRQKWLAYQREKNKRDKERGKKKLVKDMTKREHRYMKKKSANTAHRLLLYSRHRSAFFVLWGFRFSLS